MSTVSLISQFLDPAQIHQIAVGSANAVVSTPSAQSVASLCDMLDLVDAETVDEVTAVLSPLIDEIIDGVHKSTEIGDIAAVLSKLPVLYHHSVARVHSKLASFAAAASHKFIPGVKHSLHQSGLLTDPQPLEIDYVVYLLKSLETLFSSSGSNDTANDTGAAAKAAAATDRLLCFFLAFDTEEVYQQALKVVKWRIEPITSHTWGTPFLWDIIFALVSNSHRPYQTNAYIVWLRYLNNARSDFSTDSFYQQNILSKSNYFEVLQNGIVSSLHEHRKLCLSILKLSILTINSDISTPVFEWEMAAKAKHMKEWERFITVFEIVAIDTSLHQMEAASSDIISLISSDSVIHSSWGFRLLSTGFRAGTESVRKFALNLLFSIPSPQLYLVKYALPILQDIFLPYMMMANHLVVVHDKCPYGDILSNFVRDILHSCCEDKDVRLITNAFFKVLTSARDAFDPSKIYVLRGIYYGLMGKKVLDFEESGAFLVSLFEIKSEGHLYHKVFQSLNLRLLLKFKFAERAFLNALEKFIIFNGADLLNENLDIIKQYLEQSGFTGSARSDNLFVEAISLYFKSVLQGNLITPESSILFANLLGTGLALDAVDVSVSLDACKSHISYLVEHTQEPSTYETVSKSGSIGAWLLPKDLDLSSLWNSIREDVKSADEQVLRTSVSKYKFLVNLINKSNYSVFNMDQLLEFKKEIFVNSKAASHSIDFYKIKEEGLGQFYRTVDLLGDFNEMTLDHVDESLSEISPNLSNYQSNISISRIITRFLSFEVSSSQVTRCAEILLEIWDSLAAIRLQLHQKELHKLIIKAVLHPKILDLAAEDEDLAGSLVSFADSVIENSIGRRGLLPTFTKCLSQYQTSHLATFEKSSWLCEVFVKAFTMYQLKSNAFKLEFVIGDVFDTTFYTGSNLYLDIYEAPEVTSIINLLVMFNSIKSADFAASLLGYILENSKKYNLFKVIKATDGYEQWIRMRVFMIVLSIMNIVPESAVEGHIVKFISLLETDPSPLVRVYLEWIIAMKLPALPQLQDQMFGGLKDLLDAKDMKPTLVCSYQRLLLLFINQLPKGQREPSLERLLHTLIPSATSNKAMIRHFSTSLICTIYPAITSQNLDISSHLLEILDKIYNTANANANLEEYRNGDALLWDVSKDLTLVNIAGVILMRVSDHDVEYISSDDMRQYLTPDQVSALNVPVGEDNQQLWVKNRKSQMAKTTMVLNKPALLNKAPLQTKSGAWSTVMDLDDTARGGDIKRSDLIVVSSLVDKPPNLGGICRLCDVLGAGLLTLHDIRVKNHPEFKNVAVTADHWMPMTEVAIDSIVPFLRQKKQEGYTLIGLEQTDNSVELNSDLKFPKKSLILLGKEREGVPGDLLAELDMCVEIKQVGVIRSMNIQTATAIIVHAYSSQHC